MTVVFNFISGCTVNTSFPMNMLKELFLLTVVSKRSLEIADPIIET